MIYFLLCFIALQFKPTIVMASAPRIALDGSLDTTQLPSGYAVLIDQKQTGKTPFTQPMLPGNYMFSLKDPYGRLLENYPIKILPSKTTSIRLDKKLDLASLSVYPPPQPQDYLVPGLFQMQNQGNPRLFYANLIAIVGSLWLLSQSNQAYNQYQSATSQSDMDTHFSRAESLRNISYISIGLSVATYLLNTTQLLKTKTPDLKTKARIEEG